MKDQDLYKKLKKEVWLKCFGNEDIELLRSYFEKISTEIKSQTEFYIHSDTVRNFFKDRNHPSQNTLDVLCTYVLNGTTDNPKYYNDFLKVKESKKVDNTLFKGALFVLSMIGISILLWFYLQNPSGEFDISQEANIQSKIENSVVVLPFVFYGQHEDSEILNFGQYDEIITQMSKIRGIHVISRATSDHYHNTDKSTIQIAEELNVQFVLSGNVYFLEEEKIRINLELTDAVNNIIVWSESYVRDIQMEMLFELQRIIAKDVCSFVQADLCPDDVLTSPSTDNSEAHKLYSQARRYIYYHNPDSLMVALDLYQKAIDLDEKFVNAYVEKAIAYERLIGYKDFSRRKVISLMTDLINKAFSLEQRDGYTYFARAYLNLNKGDFSSAFIDFEKALEFRPNDYIIHGTYGMFLRNYGDFEKALYHVDKSYYLNPWDPVMQVLYGYTLESMGKFEEAYKIFTQVVKNHPQYARSHITLADYNQNITGRFDLSVGYINNALKLNAHNPQYALSRADIFLDLGLIDSVHAVLKNLDGIILPESITKKKVEIELFKQNSENAMKIYSISDLDTSYFFIELLIMNEKIIEAQAVLESYLPFLKNIDKNREIDHRNYKLLTYYGYCLLQKDSIEAKKILRSVLGYLEKRPRKGREQSGYHYLDAHIHAMLGDNEKAFKIIETAFNSGFKTNWWEIRNYPFYSELNKDPEFNRLFEKLESEIEDLQENII